VSKRSNGRHSAPKSDRPAPDATFDAALKLISIAAAAQRYPVDNRPMTGDAVKWTEHPWRTYSQFVEPLEALLPLLTDKHRDELARANEYRPVTVGSRAYPSFVEGIETYATMIYGRAVKYAGGGIAALHKMAEARSEIPHLNAREFAHRWDTINAEVSALPPIDVERLRLERRAERYRYRSGQRPDSEPLTDAQQQVWDFVKSNGPVTGKEIVAEGLAEQSTLTRHIIPILKLRGLKNRRGAGYYIPN